MNPQETSVLELLRCPVTHSGLRLMDEAELDSINQEIVAGKVTDRKGNAVSVAVKTSLVNADKSIAWPIRGGIMQLIADEGIEMGDVT